MKLKTICLISIQLILSSAIAHAQDKAKFVVATKNVKPMQVKIVKFSATKIKRPKRTIASENADKKVVEVNFAVDEDILEPKKIAEKKTIRNQSRPMNTSPGPEVYYSSDKDFGTENDGKFNRDLASIDNKKDDKPLSLKKALKTFKRSTERDLDNNYE